MKLATSLAFLAAVAIAQDTGTIEGVVVNKVTGAGIPGATVRVMAPRAENYDAVADETGVFRITGVKPDDYSASAMKSGYFSVNTELFLAFPGGRPKYHVSAAGDPLRVRLELNPPAVIRGRVLGADGNPARASVDLGRGRTVNTDAEGSFIFENLEAGPYTLLARPKAIEAVTAHEPNPAEVVPTYYPSVVEPTQAESIIVRAGAELSGYEIRLQSVPVYRVRGMVLNPDGKPATKAVVELQSRVAGEDQGRFFSIGGTSFRQTFSILTGKVGFPAAEEPFVTGEDGAFEFAAVRSGDWTIRAEGEPIGDESQGFSSIATTIFSLGHGDPDDFKLRLETPFRLSGTVMLSDGSPPPKGVVLSISLFSETGRAGSGGITEPGGTLRLDVIPGAHEIRTDVVMGNYYADSILLGSTDITTQRVELTPASPPIKIILKPAATIRGTIEDADSGTVVLFPQSVSGIAYSVSSGADKTFTLDGIPRGDYYAIALDHFDPRTMADTVRLRSLIPLATSVKAEPGSDTSVKLKIHSISD